MWQTDKHQLDMYIKHWPICFWHLWSTHEAEVAVGCILVYLFKNLVSISHLACLPCELYLECGSHICSVIHVKDVYSPPCRMFSANNFILVYVCTYIPLNMHVTCLAYKAYMSYLVDIFVSGTYLVITCVAAAAVCSVLVDICKNVGSSCPRCILYIQLLGIYGIYT